MSTASFVDLLAANVGVAVACALAVVAALWQLGHLSALWCHRAAFRLAGRHVFITGGSQGLGRAIAAECARLGARVTIVARNAAALAEAQRHIAGVAAASPATASASTPLMNGGDAVFCASADVTVEAQVAAAVEAAEKALGPIDMLITCAGSALTGHLMSVTTADHKRSMDLNYFGYGCSGRFAFHCTPSFSPYPLLASHLFPPSAPCTPCAPSSRA